MNLFRAALGALLGGLIGAAIWAAVAYAADLEIGWIAWGIGALAGIGASKFAAGELSVATGVMAAVIAVGSVAAGKYAAIYISVDRMVTEGQDGYVMTEEYATSYIADDVVNEFVEAEQEILWPEGGNEVPEEERDYPVEVWTEATSRWDAMSEDEQSSYMEARDAERNDNISAWAADVRSHAFSDSFELMDILFLGLAIVTAFKMGGGTSRASDSEEVSAT